jgi:hypothetical protein
LHFSPGTESRFARDLFGLGNFETSSAGAFITVVENSTKPVTTRGTHAGIAIVDQFNMQHAVTISLQGGENATFRRARASGTVPAPGILLDVTLD